MGIYRLDPAHFLSVPGLGWQACSEKTGIVSELLTNVNMILIVEKEIRGGICHAIHRNKKKESSYLMNLMQTICMNGQCVKNCL